jgi:alanyl-tRNA synthetase
MIEVGKGSSSSFTGYESVGHEARVLKYRMLDKKGRKDPSRGEVTAVEVVLDETPFYATSGGQVADRGWIEVDGTRYEVVDVFKRGGDIVHLLEPSAGHWAPLGKILSSGPGVRVMIDDERRLSIARNHTATHLLHAALRRVAGRHVSQAGSLVDEDRLRFDFNHFEGLSVAERIEIERLVNGWIMGAIDVHFGWMDYQKAVDLGAMALFDEKYGREVRVVRIPDVSIELCGGTHVSNTGQIGLFLIVSESSAAAGVRRIEALTGSGALSYARSVLSREEETAALLKVSQKDIYARAESMLEEIDSLKKEIRKLEQGGSAGEIERLLGSAARIDGVLVVSGRIDAKDVSALRNQADIFRSKVSSGVAVLSAPVKGKLQFVVTVTDDLIEQKELSAVDLVHELETIAGGGGGGKKHLAQLGTKDLESEERVFNALPDVIRKLL